jgi:hypothetical protein
LASATQKHLGRSIVIENRPGGGGITAPAQMAASGMPDGYTISQIPLSVFRAPFLTKTTYDPSKDFTYIIGVTGYAYGVVVRADARLCCQFALWARGPKGDGSRDHQSSAHAFEKGMEEPTFKSTLDLLDQAFLYMSSADYANFAMTQIAE